MKEQIPSADQPREPKIPVISTPSPLIPAFPIMPARMPTSRTPSRPIVGITLEAEELPSRVRLSASWNYAERVVQAGGMPLMLPPVVEQVQDQAALCDAFVLTGGGDPCTEPFGQPTHPKAKRILAIRQQYETALLKHLAERYPDKPVLGVCLGMQMMALVAGGCLNQHLPDTHEHADLHWDNTHAITLCQEAAGVASPRDGSLVLVVGESGGLASRNEVHSRHRQAVDDPGSLTVLARAADGVVEAITDSSRVFYLGVQWHPERTEDVSLGVGLFRAMVEALGQPAI